MLKQRNMKRANAAASVIAGLVLSSPVVAAIPLALNSNVPPPMSRPDATGCLDLVLSEAFASIGHGIEIRYISGGRGTHNADNGIDDGTFVRILSTGRRFPNLVRVPVALWQSEFVVVSKGLDFAPRGWDSLRSLTVAFPRTWHVFEKNVVTTRSPTRVARPQQLVPLLNSQRVDAVLLSRGLALRLFNGTSGRDITIHEPPLATSDLFLFLNRRHADLVPGLASALRRITSKAMQARASLNDRDSGDTRAAIVEQARLDGFRPAWFTVFSSDKELLGRFRAAFPNHFQPCGGA